jgi:hypothetical protein
MRLANSEHESQAWRITEVAPEFRLEDAWELPVQGGARDFASLLEVVGSLDPSAAESRATRALFSIRYRIGGWLGWDEPRPNASVAEKAETTLSARLPEDLRGTTAGVQLRSSDFTPLYRTDVEWAAELSNRTVHAVMHLAWVDRGEGRYRGQMGVYVKPRGRFGSAYMAAIAPFRHLIVYPALMREIDRGWQAHQRSPEN